METLIAKKRNESQPLLKKWSPFPPSPAIIWIQQGNRVLWGCVHIIVSGYYRPTDNFSLLFTEPVVEAKLHEARKMITNEKIELFNSIVGEML